MVRDECRALLRQARLAVVVTSRGLVVVTGADGFVGRALCAQWRASGKPHRAIVRSAEARSRLLDVVALGDLALAPEAELDAALGGATAVVHLAGRAHVLHERASDAAALYTAANVEATRRLARAAVRAGVGRFVLASSVKVLGEATLPGHAFHRESPPAPQDAYARSKRAAEEVLIETCSGTSLAPIVLRLPLVYGPGVRGNFERLLDAVARRALLPLGSIANRRDLLYVGNLVAAIDALLDAMPVPAGIWLVAEGQPVSTPDLIRRIGDALGVAPRLLSVPVPLLAFVARLAGRRGEIARLAQSLEVDASPLREVVGAMPYSLDQGLAATARWWRTCHAI